jgi:hypothetical protein
MHHILIHCSGKNGALPGYVDLWAMPMRTLPWSNTT